MALGAVPGLVEAFRARLSVDPSSVSVHPAPRWLPHVRSGRYSAIALPWAIYVQAEALQGDPRATAALIVHELVHMEQWRREGVVRFSWNYVRGYATARIRGADARSAYWDLPSEVRARSVARDVFDSL